MGAEQSLGPKSSEAIANKYPFWNVIQKKRSCYKKYLRDVVLGINS